MPKKVTPLSEVQVRNAKCSGNKSIKISDGGGLFLLVDPKGNRGWRFKFRFHGKEKLMSFGSYPTVSLTTARKKRDDAKALLDQGINPVEDRRMKRSQKQQEQENTFKKVALEWDNKRTDLAETTKKLHKHRLEQDIFPVIGDKPITELTPKLILDKVLRPMEKRGVGEMTYRVKSIISQICRYAVACGYIERDPTADLTGALKKVVRTHRAAITDPPELAKLLRAIDDYDGYEVVKCALQLAPLFFVRPGELRAMKWDNIDFEAREWRYLIPKTKTQHIVPLSKQAIDILNKLQELRKTSEYVFPSVRSIARPISDNTLNAALRRMGYSKDDVTVHGFRATARTILEEVLQARVEYIEHQLAHSVKDVLGRAYNRTKHIEQRRRMMQTWSDYLDGLKAGAKVLPIRHK